MAGYGLEVYDEGGRLVFDNSHRLFKIIGETVIRGSGTFQIPLRPQERPLVFPVWHKYGRNQRFPIKLFLNEQSGLLTYDLVVVPITIIYGAW